MQVTGRTVDPEFWQPDRVPADGEPMLCSMNLGSDDLTTGQATEWMQAHPFGAADAAGVDRSLVERCLALPHLARIQRNWAAVQTAQHARVDPREVDRRVNGRG
jgi:hypothetical protein